MKSYMSMQRPTSRPTRPTGTARGLARVLAPLLAWSVSVAPPLAVSGSLPLFALAACHAKGTAVDTVDAGSPAAASTAPRFDGTSESALTESAARLFDDEAPEATAAVVGRLTIQLAPRGGDKSDLRVSLERVWGVCQANPEACESATRDFVTKSVRSLRMRGQPATREQVVAIVRPRAYVDRVGGPSAPNTLLDPFVDDLYVLYVVDLPGSLRSLAASELDGLEIDRRQLPAVVTQNLTTRLGHLADALGSAEPGGFNVLRSGNVFESSRLLMGSEWAALASKVGKSVVVGAPSGDVLLVAIGPTSGQIATMRDTVSKMFAGAPRPVSPRLFQWSAKGWLVVP
jgi:uncharacterized protein YtpQ (UPF0354 family)